MAQNPLRPMVFSCWCLLARICWYLFAASGSIFSQSTNWPYIIPEVELICQLSNSEMVIMDTDFRLPLLPEKNTKTRTVDLHSLDVVTDGKCSTFKYHLVLWKMNVCLLSTWTSSCWHGQQLRCPLRSLDTGLRSWPSASADWTCQSFLCCSRKNALKSHSCRRTWGAIDSVLFINLESHV